MERQSKTDFIVALAGTQVLMNRRARSSFLGRSLGMIFFATLISPNITISYLLDFLGRLEKSKIKTKELATDSVHDTLGVGGWILLHKRV
jgi:hypothetical protein